MTSGRDSSQKRCIYRRRPLKRYVLYKPPLIALLPYSPTESLRANHLSNKRVFLHENLHTESFVYCTSMEGFRHHLLAPTQISLFDPTLPCESLIILADIF